MPLGKGKSGKEALCCLRPPADTQHAVCPAAWGMPSHTVTARTRPAGHAYAHSKGKPGSLPTGTGSPFAVSGPVGTPPAPQHGKHRFTPQPPAPGLPGMHTHSKENPGSLPTDTRSPFAVSDPANMPSVRRHGECLSRPWLFAPSHASGRAAPAQQKTGHTPRCVLFFYGIRRGYALAERI